MLFVFHFAPFIQTKKQPLGEHTIKPKGFCENHCCHFFYEVTDAKHFFSRYSFIRYINGNILWLGQNTMTPMSFSLLFRKPFFLLITYIDIKLFSSVYWSIYTSDINSIEHTPFWRMYGVWNPINLLVYGLCIKFTYIECDRAIYWRCFDTATKHK